MTEKQINRSNTLTVNHQHSSILNGPPPSPTSSIRNMPKSKTSGAAKKKNKKKAAQAARQLDSNLNDLSIENQDTSSIASRSDMIGAYPNEDTSSLTQPTPTESVSQDEDEDRLTTHAMHPSLAAATRQTQEDLLATANDLYRQIETAAAAALASHLSPQSLANIGNNNATQTSGAIQGGGSTQSEYGHAPHPDDDAYWTSLPSHLRSFIRSALPLAAGHTSANSNQLQSSAQNHPPVLPNLSSFAHATGMITSTTASNNQQNVPQLSSEQMAAAAEQLARVVQSHDWGRAVSTAAQQAGLTHSNSMNHILNGNSRTSHNYGRDINGGAATVSVTGGTVTGTIPLGSFTLPLPLHSSHPDHSHHVSHSVNVSEPVYYTGETTIVTSRMGDKHNGDDGLLDDDYYSDDGRILRNDMALNSTVLSCRHNLSEQTSNDSNMGTNHSSLGTAATGSKKKKKNKKKKSANTSSNEAAPNVEPNPTVPPPPPSQRTTPAAANVPSHPIPHPSKATSQPPQPPAARKQLPSDSPIPNYNQTNQPPLTRLPPMPNNGIIPKKKTTGVPIPAATSNLTPHNQNSASSSTIANTPNLNPPHPPTERERIRDFWLTLNQEERANLVKIEKDAVLKKMKEQQRHSCSCAVCGRKRLAIEQELEVLYDAYYDELENYAEASKKYYGSSSDSKLKPGVKGSSNPTIYPKPPGPGPFPGSVDVMTTPNPSTTNSATPKKAVVSKPTRDHKNIRPRPTPHTQHASVQNSNSYPSQPPAKRTLPPPSTTTNQPKKAPSHQSNHSDQDHTHSPSCPHHPHHHGPNHYHARGKAVVNNNGVSQPTCHPRARHQVEEDMFPDDEVDDEDDEDEYDEEDEDEYDEEEEEDQEFEDDDEIPALEEVPTEIPNPPGGGGQIKKPQVNGAVGTYNNSNNNNSKVDKATAGAAPNNNNNGDLFGFGNSLTVKGGILTVADDLLRNDGQKFLEMMESLADKRIQRERDAAENLLAGLEDEDEEEEEYDDDEEDDDDDELDEDDGFDDEIVTEEYRMKEGRRMFQIFAARMFEQRVLTAYREKVAQEKQAQLLRELEDEDRLAQERELKKVKDAQKKKEKKKAQKQQKDQDLARKMKDKEQEELAAKAAEEAKLEAERRKQEEQRLKREAQRKAQEAERAKKEEEKRKRVDEEARKRREKEEKQRLEKEARAIKEKEERERKAKEEQERKMKIEAERKEKEAREAKAREAAEQRRRAEAEKKEAEEIARREAAKASDQLFFFITAAAKLAAQNKNAAAAAAAHPKAPSRPTISLRTATPKQSAPVPKVPAAPPAQPLMPVNSFPNHTPGRPVVPPSVPIAPRQMSIGIGLGRPASAAAAPPFSAAIPSMAGPSFTNAPPRPPSAQYGTTYPLHHSFGPSANLQNLPPPEMHATINNIAHSPNSAASFPAMGGFQPPMGGGPIMQANVGRTFSGPAIAASAPQQQQLHHRSSIVSSLPPSTPTHASGLISPSLSSATSPLSALHLGSEPVRKASASAIGPIGPSSSHVRRKSIVDDGGFVSNGLFPNSIEPIGRPRANGTLHMMDPINSNSDQDSNSISAGGASPRSPVNVLGSSALLTDEDMTLNFTRRHTIPTNLPPANANPASFFSPASLDGGLGVGNSIWGATPSSVTGSGWGSSMLSSNQPAPPPSSVPRTPIPSVLPSPSMRENASDWIRRRAISAYCNMRLNEKWIPVGDVSIEMQRIHPDTANVSLKDMVDACLIKRNIHNGGGDWQFSQQGTVLFARWLPISSQEVLGSSVVSNGVPAVN
ncbi:hypothetical protein CROQUDRAFT_53542 [Cronartium quercuum f. sp. fusiforme G11]|uniref:Stress response protein NST1 n=1 Tax=Cronartium quercuum f. sp. fusiforme G11 TaxID=708437 RepID=A0A9P6N6U1_9BASI|nr:hypothetical protein CROQUDRAFT_53542 [Cronartium quercuum f. sp. fusiforme G11]